MLKSARVFALVAFAVASASIVGCLNTVTPLSPIDGGVGDGGSDGGLDAGLDSGLDAGHCSAAASNLDAGATYPGGSGPSPYTVLASADLNGDGLPDVAAGINGGPNNAPYDPGGVDVFYGKADGSLSAPTHLAEGSGTAVTLADIDGDGALDVVTANLDGPIVVYFNSPDGGRSSTPTHGAALPATPDDAGVPMGIGVGDFNGDGRPDLVVSGENSGAIFYNEGNATFGPPKPIVAQGGVFGGLVVADLNADGRPDIAVNGSSVYLMMSQADGGYETTVVPNSNTYFVGGGMVVFPDGNGLPDLALLDAFVDPSTLRVLVNAGNGVFVGGGVFSVPRYAVFLTAGDFNGDCVPDLVASGYRSCGSEGAALAFYGQPDGGFAAPVTLSSAPAGAAGVATLAAVGGGSPALAVADACGGEQSLDGGVYDGGITVLGR